MAKYNELMDRVYVTSEMKQRIYENISDPDYAKNKKRAGRFHFVPQVTAVLAAAACVALVSVLYFNNAKINNGVDTASAPGTEGVMGTYEAETYSSAEELSKAAGFKVTDLQNIPFTVTDTSYQFLFGSMAEIDYTGAGGESISYRVSEGTDDNSGDYTEYEKVENEEINGITYKFSGDGKLVNLITWTDGKYAYSISITEGTTEENALKLINNK
ncbi:MAG: DUF4367 domain-containing protein [Catonella sp.]|nr:DUF4367 domain-containing protein [Catonella sp.]MDY6356815.1 DUF4367 domain-containing protein [Catonella sp.]